MDYLRHILYTYIHYLLNGFEHGRKEETYDGERSAAIGSDIFDDG